MKEEIPKIKQMMKDLTDISYRVISQGTKEDIRDIVDRLKQLAEILDY